MSNSINVDYSFISQAFIRLTKTGSVYVLSFDIISSSLTLVSSIHYITHSIYNDIFTYQGLIFILIIHFCNIIITLSLSIRRDVCEESKRAHVRTFPIAGNDEHPNYSVIYMYIRE